MRRMDSKEIGNGWDYGVAIGDPLLTPEFIPYWREREARMVRQATSKNFGLSLREDSFAQLREARQYLYQLKQEVPTCECGKVMWLHTSGEIACNECLSRRGEHES